MNGLYIRGWILSLQLFFFTQSLRQLTGPICFLVLMAIQPSFDKQLMVDIISWDDFQKTNSSFAAVTRSQQLCKYLSDLILFWGSAVMIVLGKQVTYVAPSGDRYLINTQAKVWKKSCLEVRVATSWIYLTAASWLSAQDFDTSLC